jgi:hypothetical protein
MSYNEMANFCLNTLHATDCLNLDGGGSTSMVINGVLQNVPSDGVERSVMACVMLVQQPTESTFPMVDNFPSTGRTLPWDDKYMYNEVVPFTPTAPDGDGYALKVLNSTGQIFETTHVGDLADTNYTAESQIYCEYRPDLASVGYERCGIFARDNGNFAFTTNTHGGAYNYCLTYDTNTGHICAGKVSNGVVTDFMQSSPVNITQSGWHKFGIRCFDQTIEYYLDDMLLLSLTDSTYSRGFSGIGYENHFGSSAYAHGTMADNFRVIPADRLAYRAPADFIQPGWNFISLPAEPITPDPLQIFGGIDINNSNLQYWDNNAATGGFVSYGSIWSGPVYRGNAYWLFNSSSSKTLSYDGLIPADDYTYNIQAHADAPYWVAIGTPFNSPIDLANIRFKCLNVAGDQWLTWEQAFSQNDRSKRLVDSMIQRYDAPVKQFSNISIPQWGGVRDKLDPWYGYWLLVNTTQPISIKVPKP